MRQDADSEKQQLCSKNKQHQQQSRNNLLQDFSSNQSKVTDQNIMRNAPIIAYSHSFFIHLKFPLAQNTGPEFPTDSLQNSVLR
jgi:hypothetical protein